MVTLMFFLFIFLDDFQIIFDSRKMVWGSLEVS